MTQSLCYPVFFLQQFYNDLILRLTEYAKIETS
jgi:hypothetical protein